jgi:hypothetical protein
MSDLDSTGRDCQPSEHQLGDAAQEFAGSSRQCGTAFSPGIRWSGGRRRREFR